MAKANRHPWDQLDGETNQAYQEFLAYRDLGANRTLDKAWAITRENAIRKRPRKAPEGPEPALKGPGKAPTKSGGFKTRAVSNRWRERAHAWDAHLAAARDRGATAAAERSGEDWGKARDDLLKQGLQLSQVLYSQALYMVRMPVRDEVTEKAEVLPDGVTVVHRVTHTATDPAVMVAGSRIAKISYDMAWDTVNRGLLASAGRVAEPAPMSPADVTAVIEEAAAGMEEWHRQMRDRVAAMPTSLPPPKLYEA